jgi:hypothetical protein
LLSTATEKGEQSMLERIVASQRPWVIRLAMLFVVTALFALITTHPSLAQSTDTSQAITETQPITTSGEITAAADLAPAEAASGEEAEQATEAEASADEAAAAPEEDAAAAHFAAPGLTPLDRLCIEGAVINFDEQPLTDGWRITATLLDANGNPVPGMQLATVSDGRGNFRFDLGPRDVGRWQLVKTLKPGYGSVTPDTFIVDVAYGRTECVKVRFKQRPQIEVVVIKFDDNYAPLPNWVIRAEPGAGNVFATPTELTTGPDGRAVFALTPGLWIFSERAPAGVSFTPVIPPSGSQELNVTFPGPHTIYFKNRILGGNGCIEVRKYDAPPNRGQIPLPGWLIEVRRADGSVAASGRTFNNGVIRFSNLPPGPYRVSEESRIGWAPVTPTVFDVTVVGGAQCTVVEFRNVQKPPEFCIEGRKIDTNGKVGLPGWQITFRPLNAGGYQPAPVLTDGEGRFRIVLPDNDYRIPGASYEVCEVVQPGWLPHTPTCYRVTVPKTPGLCVRVPDFENQQKGHGVGPQPQPQPGVCRATHIVARGEGLFGIGAQYGVSPQRMLDANPWVRQRHKYYLRVGDKVCIP